MKDIDAHKQNLKGKKHFLQSLIEQGEGTQLDFKFEISDASKIARSLAAFANTEGGKLLVGVKDNGIVAGIKSDEEFYMVQAAAEMYSKPKIPFIAKPWQINGRIVLEVTIPKSKTIPHLAKDDQKNWKAWIRVNDQNILADEVMLEIWNLSKNKKGILIHYDKCESMVLNYLDENKNITVSQYCKLALISKTEAIKTLARLVVLKIIDIRISELDSYFELNHQFNIENFRNRF